MSIANATFKSHLLAAAAAVCLVFGAAAHAGADRQAELLADYRAASAGDSDAAERAYTGYSRWVEESPDNAVAQVYLGGVLALKGRDAWMPWNKLRHTERGLDTMAAAVDQVRAAAPATSAEALKQRVEVLSMAGITFTQVPRFFGRFDQGQQLLEELVSSGELAVMPTEAVAHIYLYAGEAASGADDERRAAEIYRALLARGASGEAADSARAQLAALGAE